jgi:hypothetical protein
MSTTTPIQTVNHSNKWFGNSVHEAYTSSSDRIKHVRNRALYKNTMNIAAQGGLKRVNNNSRATTTYVPATLLNSACKNLPEETGENGCVAYYIRSAPSYENLLRTTQGIYEGRALRVARGTFPVVSYNPEVASNAYVVSGIGISDPLTTTNKINYLSLTGGSTSDLLTLTPVPVPSRSKNQPVAHDDVNQVLVDPAKCMQYPPNPNISITYGGGGCYVTPNYYP